MKILGIIPARGGSKRVPQKNFRKFAGTTLTDLAIQQALNAKCLNDILVSSDSDDVLKIASAYKNVIGLKRPNEISEDSSTAIEYQIHALEYLNGNYNKNYDLVVIVQPSSPFRSGFDIDETVKLLLKYPNADSSVSVVKVSQIIHPFKLKIMEGDMLLPYLENENNRLASNDLPPVYVRNCAVYVFRVKNILNGIQLGQISVGYQMPQNTSVDINDPIEFDFAEFLYKRDKEIK